MYLLSRYNNKEKKNNFYHEIIVPLIFVALWVAGLTFSILNPQLPFLEQNNECTSLLTGLIYIYIIFILEVIVTFTDIHNVYRLYNAKKLLLEISLKTILPNIILTICSFIWYSCHTEIEWLIPFVLLSACVKLEEVWLANNGDVVFIKQQKRMGKDNIFRPQQLS